MTTINRWHRGLLEISLGACLNPLLIEVLLEEMPAKALLQEFTHMAEKFQQVLQNHQVSCGGNLECYYTPTRLVLHAPNFPIYTSATTTEHYGPPVSVGTQDGQLNAIGRSFYTKLKLDPEVAFQIATKNHKEVLYATLTSAPIPTATLLDAILLEFLRSLDFGKSMAWGDVQERFIRPIHNLCVLFGTDPIELSACTKAYGCSAKRATKVHVAKSFDAMDTPHVGCYFQVLKEGFVVLDQEQRRGKILQEIRALEEEYLIHVEIDPVLLDEIVAITSYPTALYGVFDPEFLSLPEEIITTSMKEHQRYFATFKDGMLHNGFIVVSNAPLRQPRDFALILAGNQKVLRARLSDAVFFYRNDLEKSMEWEDIAPALDQIAFVQGLGSLQDKIRREQTIALYLAEKHAARFNEPLGTLQKKALEALSLAKADLLSEVVYEFPELQGTMGYYYAKHHQKPMDICTAIKEQYYPISEGASLPSTLLSALVALSVKLDSLLALFSVKKIPTGSKDPFALRRACNGVLRICLHYQLPFNLHTDLQALLDFTKNYHPFKIALLRDFMLERLTHILEPENPNLYRSVLKGIEALGRNDYDICQIAQKLRALQDFLNQAEDARVLVSVFKRVANITQDVPKPSLVDAQLFQDKSENQLYEAYSRLKSAHFVSISDKIHALFALRDPLEVFFERVLVNDANPKIRCNRKSLLSLICHEFLSVADIKEL